MAVKLTCASCYTSKVVSEKAQVEGLDIATWWTEVRLHHCQQCYEVGCWAEVDQSLCLLDKGHTGKHMPWKDSYADFTVDEYVEHATYDHKKGEWVVHQPKERDPWKS